MSRGPYGLWQFSAAGGPPFALRRCPGGSEAAEGRHPGRRSVVPLTPPAPAWSASVSSPGAFHAQSAASSQQQGWGEAGGRRPGVEGALRPLAGGPPLALRRSPALESRTGWAPPVASVAVGTLDSDWNRLRSSESAAYNPSLRGEPRGPSPLRRRRRSGAGGA